MSVHVVVTCGGTRHEQPCRGAFHSRWHVVPLALREADANGWRQVGDTDLCPSRGHDQERTP